MTKTIPTYGYHAVETPRVFDLAPGETLPEGWHDAPVGRSDNVGEPAANVVPREELVAAAARIGDLEAIISAGRAENERLATEIDEADRTNGEAADRIERLQADAATAAADAATREAELQAEITSLKATLAKVETEAKQVTAALAKGGHHGSKGR